MQTPFDVKIPSGWLPFQPDAILTQVELWRPPESLVNVLGLFGTVVLIYWIAYLLLRKPKAVEKRTMTTPAREKYVTMSIADAVTEAVESLRDQDVITAEEALTWYRRISNAGLPDLLPKGKQILKAALMAKHPEYKHKDQKENTNIIQMKKVGQFLRKK